MPLEKAVVLVELLGRFCGTDGQSATGSGASLCRFYAAHDAQGTQDHGPHSPT